MITKLDTPEYEEFTFDFNAFGIDLTLVFEKNECKLENEEQQYIIKNKKELPIIVKNNRCYLTNKEEGYEMEVSVEFMDELNKLIEIYGSESVFKSESSSES